MSLSNYNYLTEGKNLHIDLKLYYCGKEACCPQHSWGPAVKDHFKIHYISSGKGIFQVGNKTYHLKKGQGFLICPNTASYYQADCEKPWSYSWVAFNGLHAEAYLRRANLSVENPIFELKDDSCLCQCLEEMFTASKSSRSSDVKLLSALYTFLGILIDIPNHQDSILRAPTSKEMYVKKAVEFIETNFSRQISISEIAEYVGINRKYLSKLFSQILEMPPQNFLIQYRMNRACELMKMTDLSIKEISYSVGYNDPLLFSRVFKKLHGISPNYYRNTLI